MIINKEKQLKAIMEMYCLKQDDLEWMLDYFKQTNKIAQPIIITKKKSHLKDMVK